jgi:hypothetical protein
MDSEDAASRDEAFRAAFVACAEADGDLRELERLAAEGATTAAFPDDELSSRQNFAMATQSFLHRGDGAHVARFEAAAAIVMQRGSAHLTNRAYVGNGGERAGHFVIACLAGFEPGGDGPPTHALRLLRLLLDHGLDVRTYFWRDFVASLRGPVPAWANLQREVVSLAEAHDAFVLEAKPPLALDSVRRLLGQGRSDVFEWVLDAAVRSPSMAAWLDVPAHLDASTDTLLNPFMSSKANRRVLRALAERFPFILAWLLRPPALFSLVRKKERWTLRWLVARAPAVIDAARDEQGRTLLDALADVRGRTEGIAAMLLEARES